MIPTAMLQVKPHHAVLDVCAAPGSKTSQLLESLHRDKDAVQAGAEGGFCIANDVSPERAYMLARKVKAIGGVTSSVVVTHRGQKLPLLSTHHDERTSGFDRIICDVPCSGDGTLRKDPALWAKWRPGGGLMLHSLQLQIALRGASLLKVGGIMSYST